MTTHADFFSPGFPCSHCCRYRSPPNAANAPLLLLLQGNFSSTTGLVTLGMMLLSGQVFKNYGWGTAAKATPVVLLVTGVRSRETVGVGIG